MKVARIECAEPVIGIVAYVFILVLGRLEPIADPPAT
jgi:hypothetical protein